ncbi:helix-turn-helix domain-containing protein [Phormidesmis priestleyi]
MSMSQHHFCQLLKQSTKVAPYQHLIQQRVERAKQLLKQPKLTVTYVAIEAEQIGLEKYSP